MLNIRKWLKNHENIFLLKDVIFHDFKNESLFTIWFSDNYSRPLCIAYLQGAGAWLQSGRPWEERKAYLTTLPKTILKKKKKKKNYLVFIYF